MLGHPETVADNPFAGPGVEQGCGPYLLQRQTGDGAEFIEVKLIQLFMQALIVFGPHLDEDIVDQIFVNNDPHHRVYQRDIGTGPQGQMHMGAFRHGSAPGIDDDELGAAVNGVQDAARHLGVGFGGVGA